MSNQITQVNICNVEEDEYMTESDSRASIAVFTDGSALRRKGFGTGGGAVCLIPQWISRDSKNAMATFSSKFEDIDDINIAEAKMAAKTMKWVYKNYPGVQVEFHVDSQCFMDRLDALNNGSNWFCNCHYDECLEKHDCDSHKAQVYWQTRFQRNTRSSALKCIDCGGRKGDEGEDSIAVQVQRQVERFYDIARYHGVVNVYKVAAHKKCWGNNYADMLAKWGRKMDGKLEIEFN